MTKMVPPGCKWSRAPQSSVVSSEPLSLTFKLNPFHPGLLLLALMYDPLADLPSKRQFEFQALDYVMGYLL